MWQKKVCFHDEGFRRFTSSKLEALERKGIDFYIKHGCFPPFSETWVFNSHAKVAFDQQRMEQFLALTFAKTRDEAKHYFPKRDGALCLGSQRELMADFVIVGKKSSGETWDISRNGMVKNVSEFK